MGEKSYLDKLREFADYIRWREQRVEELRAKRDNGNELDEDEKRILLMLTAELCVRSKFEEAVMEIFP